MGVSTYPIDYLQHMQRVCKNLHLTEDNSYNDDENNVS